MATKMTCRREQALLRVLRRLEQLKTAGLRASRNFSRWRLSVFLVGTALCLGLYQLAWFHVGNLMVMAFLAGFLTISLFHQRLKSRLRRLDLWILLKRDNLSRLRLDWSQIPPNLHALPPHHPYGIDLDLSGPHSLLTLVDTTFSSNGRT